MSKLFVPKAESRHWSGATVLVVAPTPTHPQDYGNRKRIYRICRVLKDTGAKIHYLHYPAESEWRGKLPAAAQRDMMREWDGYYVAVPSRPLHPDPEGKDHQIDEWWDPQVGMMVSWLCGKLMPDVVIVNYTWMSRALEHVPAGPLKVLDTHDKFSGRRRVLESAGLAPEFFYTSETEEAKAFARADVVWAIKNEEREAFATMTDRPVVSVPHIDPADQVAPGQSAPDPTEAELRLGVIGAGNAINLRNLTSFLDVAGPIFRSYLAPLKIVVGGTICDRLEQLDLPYVEKVGWVEDVRDFYRQIDVALIPMEFSTGLKIKTAEAMSLGLPMISHAHAFEGYTPFHRFHTLGSFAEVAEACVEVAFAPGAHLDKLRTATSASYRATVVDVTSGLSETGQKINGRRTVTLVCTHQDATRSGSLYGTLLASYLDYLHHRSAVAVYFDSSADPAGLARFCRKSALGEIYVNPRARDGLKAEEVRQIEDAGGRWLEFSAVMDRLKVAHLWLDQVPDLHPETAPSGLDRIYLNLSFAQGPTAEAGHVAKSVRPFLGPLTEMSVLSSRDTPVASELRAEFQAQTLTVPPFWIRSNPLVWELEAAAPEHRFGLTVIVPSARDSEVFIEMLCDVLRDAGQPLLNIIEVDCLGGPVTRRRVRGCSQVLFSRRALDSPSRHLLRTAALTINLAPHDPFANMLCSVLDAALHDVMVPSDPEPLGAGPLRGPMTLLTFIETVVKILREPLPRRERSMLFAVQRELDPGWMTIWRQSHELRDH